MHDKRGKNKKKTIKLKKKKTKQSNKEMTQLQKYTNVFENNLKGNQYEKDLKGK